jgi:peptidyl-prolyl cis-trans isomerase D
VPPSRTRPTVQQRLRTWGVYVIVVGLAFIFALQFGGPQAEGCLSGGGNIAYAARVYGENISQGDYRAAFILAGGRGLSPETISQIGFDKRVLHGLVERALLARQARELGFRFSEKEVMRSIAEKGEIYVSLSVEAPPLMLSQEMGALESGPRLFDFTDKDGNFDPKHLRGFVQYELRRGIKEFTQGQIDERLAQLMRDTVTATVLVSEAEVWDEFAREQDKAVLKYVRFSPEYFRSSQSPDREKIDSWIKENAKTIDEVYEKQRERYTGLPKQVRARHILIKVAQDADEPGVEKARQQAEKLAQEAKAGADFATLAREHSQDTGSARRGGDLGYNPRGRMVEAFDQAQFSLQPGQISDPVRTRYGFHVIKVEGVREGDVPEQEAKQEIGKRLMLQQYGQQLAAQAAGQALERLQQGTSMEEFALELGGGEPGQQQEKSQEQGGEQGAEQQGGEQGAEQQGAKPVDPLAPRVLETKPFGRVEVPIAGPFDSVPLVKSAFELSEEQPLPDRPLRLGEDWFVYRLQSRERADRADFTEEVKAEITRVLLFVKRREALAEYVSRLKKEALARNALRVRQIAGQQQSGLQQ